MKEKYMSRQQLAQELGISARTLSRKLDALKITLPPGLIPPKLCQQLIELLRS
ncbi:helix-turn-helix domain-containing protein [Dyadobacter sp. CY323]|uniref:helix-turn-helix domain-containing protein n=1 Tax=Dyadobacter sp. CY323 TaxID=2907302 RepID=UPI001F39F0C0|nr:helix-turn-helix domain-containing protein [Dyadobacter sp. CY323]MCE6990458.1 HTH domain-containing protein [Dyadobacter sp. CY323]